MIPPKTTFDVKNLYNLYQQIDFKDPQNPNYLEPNCSDPLIHLRFQANLRALSTGAHINMQGFRPYAEITEKIAEIFKEHEANFQFWGLHVRDLARIISGNFPGTLEDQVAALQDIYNKVQAGPMKEKLG